jgi:hypothetical protein
VPIFRFLPQVARRIREFVALVREGYTGYLLRARNDDMGDAPGLGTAGSIGDLRSRIAKQTG